ARVRRGDAPPLELDLASAELADARARLAVAEGEVRALEHDWRELTGCAAAPEAAPETVMADEPSAHPGLRLADAEVEAARARHLVELRRRAQPPTVGLLVRRERGEALAPWIDAVGVNVTVPIGRSGARIRARGEAAAAAAEAEAARSAIRRSLVTARAAADARLAAARAALNAARDRAELAEQARGRAHRAWETGAWDTSELLRVEGRAAEARLAAELAEVSVGLAIARLNQSVGVLP
ncbi:MAG: TolC family protein, partial [Pseudomonadales bacterium]|nr:TolC family protein [Pseudomonadales bacterium]